jgi:opacity protein-like surface antigen
LTCIAVLLGCAAPSTAQSAPGAEFSAGWRLLNVPNAFGSQSETLPLGWYADVAGNLNRAIAVVGEISGNYKSFEETETQFGVNVRTDVDLNIHTFLGGVRFNARQNPAFTPYVQALFGLARGSADADIQTTIAGRTTSFKDSESDTDFAFDAGGGVNINLSDSFAVRVGAGYLRIGARDGGNAFRFSAGVVVPF